MQVWDVLRAMAWVRERLSNAGCRVALFGRGDAAVVAMLAGILDVTVTDVVLSDPQESFRRAAPLLTVLRDTDLPELAGLLAPRPLTFVPRLPASFGCAQIVYELLGAVGNLVARASVVEALFFDTVEDGKPESAPQC